MYSSKDTLINVYSRSTLALHAVLRGHEGPVNAIGFEGGRVVSASGDGRMMLWDAGSGRCERIFEGHERGLACIEFKVCPCLYPRPS
jgi:WD40 repeat protein